MAGVPEGMQNGLYAGGALAKELRQRQAAQPIAFHRATAEKHANGSPLVDFCVFRILIFFAFVSFT